jgi:DNA-binding NarL/FixJ family response regulator
MPFPSPSYHAICLGATTTQEQIIDILQRNDCRVTVLDMDKDNLQCINDPPDLIICDIGDCGLSTLQVIKSAQNSGMFPSRASIIAISRSRQRSVQLHARRIGRDEYVTAPIDLELFTEIIRYRLSQRKITPPNSRRKSMLTQRETQTLTLVARGKTSAEIAKLLKLSERTVNFHIDNAIHKMRVSTRAQAAVQASMLGVLQQ